MAQCEKQAVYAPSIKVCLFITMNHTRYSQWLPHCLTRILFMPAITLTTLQGLKQKGEKITMLTCYDATFAHACNQAGVEVLLVGDSLGMVLQGHDSTLPVTTAECTPSVSLAQGASWA